MTEKTKKLPPTETFIRPPAIQHRWAFDLVTLDENLRDALKLQALNARLNIAKGELEAEFEQPLNDTDFLKAIDALRCGDNTVEILFLDGNADVASKYVFRGKMVDHAFVMDYTSSDVVKHTIKFKSNDYWTNRKDDSIT